MYGNAWAPKPKPEAPSLITPADTEPANAPDHKPTDDATIVRDEADAIDAEGNKRAAEDKAAVANSRTEAEKIDDATRAMDAPAPSVNEN